MQPQDTQTPGAPQPQPVNQPPPAPPQPGQPSPMPQPPVPGHVPPAPAGPPFGQPGVAQPAHKKPMAALLALIVVGVLVLGGLGYLAYTFFTAQKLETYTGDKFSMLVPVDYTKDDSGDGTVTFTEKGDENTASKVVAYYNKFPSAITEDQLKTIKGTFKTQLESLAKGLGTSDDEIDKFDVKDTKYKGQDAFELTATFKKDGKNEGNVRLVAVITTTDIYVVGVAAHVSDGALDAKKNEIIDSFKVK